ncbi:MAG: HEAT repeat domain-containing protein [Planctomycetes bacterium]|nr:HEAT repeat domain-containing protein [Planctomycetota bacterium]
MGWTGHGLHGLTWGPDGKLYFSLGDVDTNVTTPDAHVEVQDSGCVFRCDPDGTQLELVHKGLRNPQELAFDDFGNLFTVDNDQDPGDESRLVYIVEGGDSGWRSGVLPLSQSPWLREKIWRKKWPGQSLAHLPPIAELPECQGPGGIAFDPGTGLPPQLSGNLFLCNFAYTLKQSGILALKLASEGASYRLEKSFDFARNVVPSDLDFAPDGSMYVAGWGDGGQAGGESHVYRLFHPESAAKKECQEVSAMLAADWTQLPETELITRLGHPNRRIRQEAQFELAARSTSASALIQVAHKNPNRLARVHALWALGQLGKQSPTGLDDVVGLLDDPDAEVRIQTLRVLGDNRVHALDAKLSALVKDTDVRVQVASAHAIGKLKAKAALPALESLLLANDSRDRYLLHAGVVAFTGVADLEALRKCATSSEPALRMVAALAFRRLEHAEIATMLGDPDPMVNAEVVRAIHDGRILEAFPQLAKMARTPGLPDAVMRRALHANRILGTAESAANLAVVAASRNYSAECRDLAMRSLLEWADPIDSDQVTGVWWQLPPRPADVVKAAVEPIIEPLFKTGTEPLRLQSLELCRQYRIESAAPAVKAICNDDKVSAAVRAVAAQVLPGLNAEEALNNAREILQDSTLPPVLRVAFLEIIAKADPEGTAKSLAAMLSASGTAEKQAVWSLVKNIDHVAYDPVLMDAMTKLAAGESDPGAELELVEAARKRTALVQQVQAYEEAKPATRVGKRQAALHGGDAKRGRELFESGTSESSCIRCHSVKYSITGGIVGPDIFGVGGRMSRSELLESIVEPNKKIAAGFESISLLLTDGRTFTGVLVREESGRIVIRGSDRQEESLAKGDIENRKLGLSAMPEGLADSMSDRDLRDLVAYLASLQPRTGMMFNVRRLREKLPPRRPHDAVQRGLP